MHLTPHEQERLMLSYAAELAHRRRGRGLRLKVPRKGGPGVTASDLLVVNKTDLADRVGADLGVMARDADRMRGGAPVLLTSLTEDPAATAVSAWLRAAREAWRGRTARPVA